MDEFSASYDRTTKIVTAIACVLLAIPAATVHHIAVRILSIVVILMSIAYSPRSYSYAEGSVVVCKWHVADRSKAVVVRIEKQAALFSPDDRVRFVSTSISASSAANRAGAMAVAAVAVIGAAVAALIFLYAPGPPGYSLTPDSLTIHDRFYPVTIPAGHVAVKDIRVIDFARDPEWRPTRRTNGFATLHYHSGWFRVAGGEKVRMYRADSTRLVLLPPKGDGAPVLYEVKDPDELIRSLQREWASHS